MFRIIILSLVLCLSFTVPVQAGIWDSIKNAFSSSEKAQPPTIRVLIVHDVDAAMLEVKGRYNIYDPYKNSRLGSRFIGKSNLIQPLAGGLKWGEEFPGVFQLSIVPDQVYTTVLIDGIEYKGKIYIYDIGGSISIINEVDIEDYLSSVLNNQIDKPLSEEALAAVVITARTHAYYQATGGTQNPYWHVDAKKVNYHGFAIAGRNKGVDAAIASTRYMVMSRTGAYEGAVTPFATSLNAKNEKGNALSFDEAEAMASKGHDAAKILAKTFPNSSIQLTHVSDDASAQVAEANPRSRR